MNDSPLVWIIIGVSGSGKTSVGRLLAQQLACDFLEGDRRHPPANIIKMFKTIPLEDKDRLSWLSAIKDDIQRAIDHSRETVITCSALKKQYRQQLTSLGRVQLIWLDVNVPTLEERLQARKKHYMKPEMLLSQIIAFEAITEEENVITIDANGSIDSVAFKLLTQITLRFPQMAQSWWKRSIG
jgi:gluconokinase